MEIKSHEMNDVMSSRKAIKYVFVLNAQVRCIGFESAIGGLEFVISELNKSKS